MIENNQVKLLWDFKIQTDHHLDHNRPDIVVLEKASSLVPNHRRGMSFWYPNCRKTGAPNDGFLLRTLKTLFSLARVLSVLYDLEMHSKRGYKICIFSVILGELESFRNFMQGFEYYFLENFRCYLTYYEREAFSDSSLHHIFESENFRFRFSY